MRLYKAEAVSRSAAISLPHLASAPIFHSPDGSAIELQDTAELQIQVLDGDKVLHSEDVTMHYVALLTAAENSWEVRVLEAVPAF